MCVWRPLLRRYTDTVWKGRHRGRDPSLLCHSSLPGVRAVWRLVEVPVLSSSLRQDFVVFPVPSVLFLVLLEAYAVGKDKVGVFVGVVYSVFEACGFFLAFGFTGLLHMGFLEEGGGEVGEGSKGHVPEVFGPLCGLSGLPLGVKLFVPVRRGGKGLIPHDFAVASFGRVCKRSKAYGFVVASDTRVDVGTGPELRLEVGRGEKEINNSGVLMVLGWPWCSGGRVWGKRAGYPQVMGDQEFTQRRVPAGLPLPFTSSNVLSYSSTKRGKLSVKVRAPEQTASRGGMGEDVEVLGEGVEGVGEFFRAVSGGREVEAKDDNGRVEGEGRQNVVLGHYGPFQKTAKTGGGDDAGCTSSGAFARYEPKLGISVHSWGVVDETLLEADEIPWGFGLEVVDERAYVCLSEGACVPSPQGNALFAATGGHAMRGSGEVCV